MPNALQDLIWVSGLAIYCTGAVALALALPRTFREGRTGPLDPLDYLFCALLVLGWPALLLDAKFNILKRR
jgi:hypothetical protein